MTEFLAGVAVGVVSFISGIWLAGRLVVKKLESKGFF